MAADKCMNRNHCLGTPPPARADSLLPRSGCMPCLEGSDVDCPYRAAYGCAAETQHRGRMLGHCAIEQDLRDHERLQFPTVAAEAGDRGDEARLRLELYLDALLYSIRANTWISIAWDLAATTTADPWTHPVVERSLMRYQSAASERIVHRAHGLRTSMSEIETARQVRERQAQQGRVEVDRAIRLLEQQERLSTHLSALPESGQRGALAPGDIETPEKPDATPIPTRRLPAPSLPTQGRPVGSGSWARGRRSTLPGGRTIP